MYKSINMKKKKRIKPLVSKVTIGDLLDMVHLTIIKKRKINNVILKELKAIDEKIKKGKLKNYEVDCPLYWVAIFKDIEDNGYKLKLTSKTK